MRPWTHFKILLRYCQFLCHPKVIYLMLRIRKDSKTPFFLTLKFLGLNRNSLDWKAGTLSLEFAGDYLEHNIHKITFNKPWLKEIAAIELHCQKGIVITSKCLEGDWFSVSNPVELAKICYDQTLTARRQGLNVERIHIIHSHPNLEASVTQGMTIKNFTNPLTQADHRVAKYFRDLFQIPTQITAINYNRSDSYLFELAEEKLTA